MTRGRARNPFDVPRSDAPSDAVSGTPQPAAEAARPQPPEPITRFRVLPSEPARQTRCAGHVLTDHGWVPEPITQE